MKTKGAYDWKAKEKQYRGYSNEALAYAVADIRETLRIWPDHPNAGWYLDDLHTVAAEIRKRNEAYRRKLQKGGGR